MDFFITVTFDDYPKTERSLSSLSAERFGIGSSQGETLDLDNVHISYRSLLKFNGENVSCAYESNAYIAFAQGEIYDIEGNKASLKDAIDFVYAEDKEQIRKVNGQFIIFIWDKRKKEALIINDRFAYMKCYYTFSGSKLYLSDRISSIVKIKKGQAVLSKKGVFQILFFGHHLSDYTIIENIQCLPPASHLQVLSLKQIVKLLTPPIILPVLFGISGAIRGLTKRST